MATLGRILTMLGTVAQILLLLANALNVFIVGLCVRRGWFRRYLFLNLFLIANSIADVVRVYTLYAFGYTSVQYFYAYLYSDVVLSLLSYLLILSFFDEIFRHSLIRPYVRPTLGFLFLIIVGISGLALQQTSTQVLSRMFYELQQNLYFAGLLLNFFLWIALNHLQVESRRLALLVSGLGILYASNAAKYSFHYLFKGTNLSTMAASVSPSAFVLMVSLWAYTLLRVPDDAPVAEPVSRPEEMALPARLRT